ncbi:MAG: nickel transporter, partial [Xanthobacteraceae bacterium]|nr:nickel transporter [Xanthobacteraceae bacterium]
MQIIPVLDLKNGTVVRAQMGKRDRYRPIATPLASSSVPIDVARGLLSVHPFATLYVADLDAIEGWGDNEDALARLRQAFPHVSLWVDNGICDLAGALARLASTNDCLVLGSETQRDPTLVRKLSDRDRVVLSLDFRGAQFAGPAELLDDPSAWPHRLIVMTLARVGSGAGPDTARIAEIRARASGRSIYAAGGVRDARDLSALQQLGVSGALVATSLHDGRLTGADIA